MNEIIDLKLGLIGEHIQHSKAPLLHYLAGRQGGLHVQYNLLSPSDLGNEFDFVFNECAIQGYRGVNITYPFKERASLKVSIDDPFVEAIGAVNTVLFETDGPRGFNTDFSGFMTAYRMMRGKASPGICCLIGAGGVGRALAFGLVKLGATEIRIVDIDKTKADTLKDELRNVAPGLPIIAFDTATKATSEVDGLLNATPIGMVGFDGTPLPAQAMKGAVWAFDAIYTPKNTKFLSDATSVGLEIIPGYELFFYQGVDAWMKFSNQKLDEEHLRKDLRDQAS